MKRLTVYLKNQKKVEIDGKKKLYNVKSFHHVSDEDAAKLVATFNQREIVKYELVNYKR